MRKKPITSEWLETTVSHLSPEERNLVEQAIASGKKAYAPYSGFYVGAALLLENGEIILGNNQENIAFPSGLCAERVAFFFAKANYPEIAISKAAIVAHSPGKQITDPVTPCGSCRQVMAEYEFKQKKKIKIILATTSGKVLVTENVFSMLPMMFRSWEVIGQSK